MRILPSSAGRAAGNSLTLGGPKIAFPRGATTSCEGTRVTSLTTSDARSAATGVAPIRVTATAIVSFRTIVTPPSLGSPVHGRRRPRTVWQHGQHSPCPAATGSEVTDRGREARLL